MISKFSIAQLYIFAKAMSARFKENPDLFKLLEPPKHSLEIQLSSIVYVEFRTMEININSGKHGLYETDEPFPLFHPIKFIMYRIAHRRLYSIANTLLKGNQSKGDRLLYDLLPEMLEKNLKRK